MQQVEKYIRKHHQHLTDVFQEMAIQDALQATKVFNYIQNTFNLEDFKFIYQDKNFFANQENGSQMQKILQSYYRKNEQDDSKKFHIYRIQFKYEQIGDILQFWLKKEPKLNIKYTEDNEKYPNISEQPKKQIKIEQEDDKQPKQENQFDIENNQIPEMIEKCNQELRTFELLLVEPGNTEEQISGCKNKISQIKIKIKLLQQRYNATSERKQELKEIQHKFSKSVNLEDNQSKVSSSNRQVNYKALFDFYAKQIYSAGTKATFQRIQNQSKSINYQKLVHFLREFDIMPKRVGVNKKVHLLYLKNCENTQTLNYHGFMNVLIGVIGIMQPQKNQIDRKLTLDQRIIIKQKKNKGLSNPFYSPEKQDFRIDPKELKYNFKIVPQFGKFQHQVLDQLEKRRRDKSEAKSQRQLVKHQRQVKDLKRLQAIDPFNEKVMKNAKILQKKSIIEHEPIANLQNIQKYRDQSFDFGSYFGDESKTKGHKQERYQRNYSGKGDQSIKKAEKLERYEAEKMKSLMNGIIQRSNAKLEKLGISPQKSHQFY